MATVNAAAVQLTTETLAYTGPLLLDEGNTLTLSNSQVFLLSLMLMNSLMWFSKYFVMSRGVNTLEEFNS